MQSPFNLTLQKIRTENQSSKFYVEKGLSLEERKTEKVNLVEVISP